MFAFNGLLIFACSFSSVCGVRKIRAADQPTHAEDTLDLTDSEVQDIFEGQEPAALNFGDVESRSASEALEPKKGKKGKPTPRPAPRPAPKPPAETTTPKPPAEGAVCATQAVGQRVVSIADLHGDFDGMLRHLYRLGLVTSQDPGRNWAGWGNLWAGGTAIFVQTGDILDRGPDGMLMYKFLWALQDEAAAAGGQVILLTGNHELMVLQGDVRYVSGEDFCQYSDVPCAGSGTQNCGFHSKAYVYGQCSLCKPGNCEFLKAWDKDGEMGSELRLRFRQGKMKLTYKVNGVVFTHAGLVPFLFDKIGLGSGENAIDELNNQTADLFSESTGYELLLRQQGPPNQRDPIVGGTKPNGPMWSRICFDRWLTSKNADGILHFIKEEDLPKVTGRCEAIEESLNILSADRMVIGHCPGDFVQTSCSGKIVMADTKMSIAYAGTREQADENMAAIEFFSQDSTKSVWAVYSGQDRCTQLE